MPTAIICERWSVDLQPTEHDEWFGDWVFRSPKEAGLHLAAGYHAVQALKQTVPEVGSAREYFGGMGAQALMVRDAWHPQHHVVMDYSADACAHMRRFFHDGFVKQADSYDPANTKYAGLAVLDFGDLTVWKTREGEKHRELLDRVFALNPLGVLLTDIACRYLHLHRERYETLLGLGTCGSYEDYLEALVTRIEKLWGYTLVAGYTHRWSTVMALAPTVLHERGQFEPVPASPVGLVLR